MNPYFGKFVWYQLHAKDRETAKSFYESVLRLTPHVLDYEGQSFLIFGLGDTMFAGVDHISDPDAAAAGGVPKWMGYVGVENVDETAEKVVSLGGKITLPPTEIPETGRYAVALDPDSVPFVFSSYLDPSAIPEVDKNQFGYVGWSDLESSNPERSMEFYSSLFGWEALDRHDMGPLGFYNIFGIDQVPAGGIYTSQTGENLGWVYYFTVDNATDAAARVVSAGGKVIIPPHQVPGGGWIVRAADPEGAEFAMMSSDN